ncbi:hypothetical protein HZH68_009736 [Vespula germanica]|uniref:Uncharacterized protein n=1 Tax=Vespula germanica TaxID=30212 RepID=A0A834K1V1_VESGE|nr:hypothetical protein HZH68_009736 [Vespula germanica]
MFYAVTSTIACWRRRTRRKREREERKGESKLPDRRDPPLGYAESSYGATMSNEAGTRKNSQRIPVEANAKTDLNIGEYPCAMRKLPPEDRVLWRDSTA